MRCSLRKAQQILADLFKLRRPVHAVQKVLGSSAWERAGSFVVSSDSADKRNHLCL